MSFLDNAFGGLFGGRIGSEPGRGSDNSVTPTADDPLAMKQRGEQTRRNNLLRAFEGEVGASFTSAEERNTLLGGLNIGIADFDGEINKRRGFLTSFSEQNTFLQKSKDQKAAAPGRPGTILSATPTLLG